MAIRIEELKDSREMIIGAAEKTLVLQFMIYGTDDPDEAALVGPQINELWDDELRVIERRFSGPIKPAGAGTEEGVLHLTVTYRFRIEQTPGDPPEYQLNVGVVSERVFKTPPKQTLYGVPYNALTQTHYGAPGADDQDEPGDLIETKDDKTVEGVDVLLPTTEYTETRELSSFTTAQRKVIVRLTAKVNEITWRGWEPGEVLFLGAQAHKRKGENWRITYSFRIGVNALHQLAVDTGDVIEYIKLAHEYVWFRSSIEKNGVTDILEQKIHDVHVAPVYQPADFAELGLGTEELS